MRGARRILRVFGIDILIHYSWWFVFILLTWTLSASFFPNLCSGELIKSVSIPDCTNLPKIQYWIMGTVASLLLFVSVLLHELSHSLVARMKKIKVDSITLFFFGGVAGIDQEDMKPSSEFFMAIAGPLFSLFLAAVFYFIFIVNGNGFWTAITFYLYRLNLVLAIFNLVPGYPLDGGRAFRAVLHYYYKDLKKATKIAATGGRIFAVFMIAVGILSIVAGAFGGLWFVFLGGFLYFIAGVSYEQVVLKDVLSKVSVKEILTKKYKKISPEMSFYSFLKKNANSGEEVFLVKSKKFSGILDLRTLGKTDQQTQKALKIKQVSLPLSKVKSLSKDDNAYTAFKKFAEQKVDLLPVMDKDKFLGFVTRRVVMNRLIWSLKYGFSKESSKSQEKKNKKKWKWNKSSKKSKKK